LSKYFSILEGKDIPTFQKTKNQGLYPSLKNRVKKILRSCTLCERRCKVNRLEGKVGFCGVGETGQIASMFVHYGEEEELVPSLTIFWSGCNARCCYCQNYDISQNPEMGEKCIPSRIASKIDQIADDVKNINFVGGEPTPNLFPIINILERVKANLPVIWNSNFYMSTETMDILKTIVDLYLPDFRYGNDRCAIKYSQVPRYLEVIQRNLLLGAKQGDMIIRVLVLPNHVECCTKPILDWINENIGEQAITNIMDQYYPTYHAYKYPSINRRLHPDEYASVVRYAKKIGLKAY
jgi:putative pyruvate formate lyase activating enzyme